MRVIHITASFLSYLSEIVTNKEDKKCIILKKYKKSHA